MISKLENILRTLRISWRDLRYSRFIYPKGPEDAILNELCSLFVTVNGLLNNLGVDYWLEFGTLLGFYREKHLIRGDEDVDFGAQAKDFNRIWAARHLLPKSYRMVDASRYHNGPKLYFISPTGWEADIYFYKERSDKLQRILNSPYLVDKIPIPKSLIFPTKLSEFLGAQTRIPHKTKDYLEFSYHYIGYDAVIDPVSGYWSPRRDV